MNNEFLVEVQSAVTDLINASHVPVRGEFKIGRNAQILDWDQPADFHLRIGDEIQIADNPSFDGAVVICD